MNNQLKPENCIIWVTVLKTDIKITNFVKYTVFEQFSGSIIITHYVFKMCFTTVICGCEWPY